MHYDIKTRWHRVKTKSSLQGDGVKSTWRRLPSAVERKLIGILFCGLMRLVRLRVE